ncbi:MAG: hypothetical protein EHM57_03845 [Actinobacteria bacterium]|nr:MAG: hypothetical protein EHM57_03845 [Actinomycetota bacterium]
MDAPLPLLPDDVEPTRATLHAYLRAVAAVPRAHGIVHPRWWHIACLLRPDGLTTAPVPLPDGRSLSIRVDPRAGRIVIEASDAPGPVLSMTEGLTASELGDRIIDAAAAYGLEGPYDRASFADDGGGEYDPGHAAALFAAFTAADQLFTAHRAQLRGEVGPIQVWPHGFDIAFEWFGTRTVEHIAGGETAVSQAQLNLGFYPSGRPYFYSSPWPFEADVLLPIELPHGASWHTDGWLGSVLYYDEVAGVPDGRERVLAYARAVFAAAAPTLTA